MSGQNKFLLTLRKVLTDSPPGVLAVTLKFIPGSISVTYLFKLLISNNGSVFKTLDILIKKERVKNRELKRRLGIVESKTNSSNEMIDDYSNIYDYGYLRNWALFISIITSGIFISVVFKKQNVQLN